MFVIRLFFLLFFCNPNLRPLPALHHGLISLDRYLYFLGESRFGLTPPQVIQTHICHLTKPVTSERHGYIQW